MAQLQHWCKGEGINPIYAILVKDVPEDTENDFVEETLQSIKALGRVKVRGRMYDPRSQSLTVLCECREEVNTRAIPLDVLPEGCDSPWRIFGPSEEETVFKAEQIRGDAPELPQVSGLSFPLQASTPEAIIRAVGDIMQRTGKPASDNISYRRLRTFSGVLPTPPGEEQLDNWIEQARLMIEECDRPEREKRMKIMESVKGPALEILQAVRFNDPDATPTEYIDVIENTFGTPETGEELYFAFRMLCQQPSERLSAFLRRMERVLNKVVQKGGLQPASADKARLDQLIKGATRSDMMLLNLRLRERRDQPPTFLQLLNEIRTEEEYEASRRKLNPAKSVHVKTVTLPAEAEIRDLRVEIQELKSQLTELTALSIAQSPPPPAPESAVTTEVEASGEDKNIQALKKEVKKLRK
ncbi:paraneoplastic antigen Ma1 homolog [Epinephelus lanceolatus]